MGNPWLFRQINAYLTDTRVLPEPGIHERMAVMLAILTAPFNIKASAPP